MLAALAYSEPSFEPSTTDSNLAQFVTSMSGTMNMGPGGVGGGAGGDNHSSSSADKKRNKLGYHRTAIACGHCRRRKIRCIPPADATSNRCQNCVRLKKDCQYYPVDQTTQSTVKRSRTEPRLDGLNIESGTSISSSSSGIANNVVDQYDPYRAQLESPTISRGGTTYPALGTTPSLTSSHEDNDYEYPSQFNSAQWSSQNAVGQYPRPPTDLQSQNYWPQSEQGGNAPFHTSSYAMSAATPTTSLTSPDQQYSSYPTTTAEYQYPSNQHRDDSVANGNPMQSYGLYRANTLPDSRELHPSISLSSQSTMTSPYAAAPPTNHYQSGNMGGRWPDSNQMPPSFPPQGNTPAWYGANLNGNTDANGGAHVLSSQRGSSNQYRSNPG